jgi:hypothetical protein
MSMPKATMDKYHLAAAWKDNVWRAWQMGIMHNVAITKPVQHPPKRNFGTCIFGVDRSHDRAASNRVNVICH